MPLTRASLFSNGDIVFSNSIFSISADTSDGSDTKELWFSGGGGTPGGFARGAHLRLMGNENVAAGGATLQTGDNASAFLTLSGRGTNSYVVINTGGGNERWRFAANGDITQSGSNGGSITLTRTSTIVTPGVCTTGISAAGSIRTDATALTAFFNNVTTVGAGQGVALWDAPVNSMLVVRNAGANALNVYPENGTNTINGGGGGVAVSVATASIAFFFHTSSTAWTAVEFAVAAA